MLSYMNLLLVYVTEEEARNILTSLESTKYSENIKRQKMREILDQMKYNNLAEIIKKKKIDCNTLCSRGPEYLFEQTHNHIQVEDGIFQCYKCDSKKTTSYSLQTRSADEPMTVFITCVECSNKWKM